MTATAALAGVLGGGHARAQEPEKLMFWPSMPYAAGSVYKGTLQGMGTPEGWKDFCARNGKGNDCVPVGAPHARVVMLHDQRQELAEAVARATTCDYEDDAVTYGVEDYWDKPDVKEGCKADCDGWAILVRDALLQKGWPSSALLLTSFSTANNPNPRLPNHLALTVRTTLGDLVVDRAGVFTPAQVARHDRVHAQQSPDDPNVWQYMQAAPQPFDMAPMVGPVQEAVIR